MSLLRLLAIVVGGLLVVAALADGAVLSASNQVPGTSLAVRSQGIGANDLKPWYCAAFDLSSVVTGSKNFSGTNASELLLGNASANRIDGNGGNDCILGGAGRDRIDGGSGFDICIGSYETRSYDNCEWSFP